MTYIFMGFLDIVYKAYLVYLILTMPSTIHVTSKGVVKGICKQMVDVHN
jgi:hypothetical protein